MEGALFDFHVSFLKFGSARDGAPSANASDCAIDLGADPLETAGGAIGRVAPIGNRLLLFYADVRVPHEVLPAYADRLAITLWYYDSSEVQRATGRA